MSKRLLVWVFALSWGGAVFAQSSNPGWEMDTTTVPGTPSPVSSTASDDTTTTINSGYDSGNKGGNVLIQSLNSTGDVVTKMTVGNAGVTFSNDSGGPVKVTGVANGTSTYDAVNYGQLSAVQSQVDNLSRRVDTVAGGVASVAAMANIPMVNDPKKAVSLGAGVGTFMGQSAVALGATVRLTKSLTAKASVSTVNGGEQAAGVGIAYGW